MKYPQIKWKLRYIQNLIIFAALKQMKYVFLSFN